MPWVIIGDFNMSPKVLEQSNFVAKIYGVVRAAPNIEGTCSQRKGPYAMLDYIVMSESAVPFVRDISA
eukprot:6247653-Pyramimonas_sp.AAC.1